jgi:hypothetical protein
MMLQFWYLCELLYVLANCLLKFSIGYFYLRVAVQKWHIWCIRLLQLGTVLFGLIYFFLVMLQCLPSECNLLLIYAAPTDLPLVSVSRWQELMLQQIGPLEYCHCSLSGT